METGDSFNQGRGELFEGLKDRCRSRAKASTNPLLIIVIILMLVMATLIFGLGKKGPDDIALIYFWMVFCCMVGLIIMYNFWFCKEDRQSGHPRSVFNSF